jgi:inositol phosphorylceramide mannosyltransferase catalytic subunit
LTNMDNPRAFARSIIERCLGEARAGDLMGAQAGLDRLAADAALVAQAELGPKTVLGLPRKLHAANLKLAKISGDKQRITYFQFTFIPDPDIMSDIGQYDGAERRAIAHLAGRSVPRILHQIWIGDLPPPPAIDAWRRHCAAFGFEYRLWGEKELLAEGFEAHPAFGAMMAHKDYPGAADVARYLILERLGGIYLDADWYPARDDVGFEHFMALAGFTAMAEKTPRLTSAGSLLLANYFIATPSAHPVLQRILDAIPRVMDELPDAPAWWSTGPVIFTNAALGAGVTLATADMVAASLPRRAPFEAVETARNAAMRTDKGFLIDWKSW